MSDFKFDCVYFMGDFNADPFSGRAWQNLSDFFNRNNLDCFDFNILERDTFTFCSYGNSHCKWLDHFIGRNCTATSITEIVVHHDLIGSDHLPISAKIILNDNIPAGINHNFHNDNPSFIDWGKLKPDEIDFINFTILNAVEDFMKSSRAAQCFKLGCSDRGHIVEICKVLR